ncbi:acyl carrier protein [Herbaspirillum sp. Sphag1AN]|uniref:acyl carrier protein n=1 Tax=unclassified Herbaspirillum TaxID=2624150 RepID=UPI00160F22DC|nr:MULTISPECIES: acyl carrier protein [unclassified Herbaspirillum]MBB3211538.1 acyl carrier protein [Herbaspirillum sp. Sphag1AN]MBB3245195.1 acyl carrier protein [Herbaspirillum sp. Sphag64]
MENFASIFSEGDAAHADTAEKVNAFLADYFMVKGDLEEATCLVDDLGADSLDLLQVIQELSDIFQIGISADHLPRMLTVGGVCEVVEELRSQSPG